VDLIIPHGAKHNRAAFHKDGHAGVCYLQDDIFQYGRKDKKK
jgi:hypothetical protein